MDLNGHRCQHVSLKSGVEHLALGDYASGDTVAAPPPPFCGGEHLLFEGFLVSHLASRREREISAGEPPGGLSGC